jgi:hypothetical protein
MHAAHLESSPRLQRVAALLSDGPDGFDAKLLV